MARIRTVKPEFFRHEKLQELGALSMLIFEGLWTQSDKAGRFAWKPRLLKLDILPFISFDMEKELDKLADAFFVIKYEHEKEFFGVIPTFGDHQRITGKEGLEPAKYPVPPEPKPKKTRKLPQSKPGNTGDTTGTHSGHVGDEPESQEGKGRGREEEREQEEEGNGGAPLPFGDPLFLSPDFRIAWEAWLKMRNTEKIKLTDHAKALNFAELKKFAGDDLGLAIKIVNKSIERSWKGFFQLKEDSNEFSNRRGPENSFGKKEGVRAGQSAHAKAGREFPEHLSL